MYSLWFQHNILFTHNPPKRQRVSSCFSRVYWDSCDTCFVRLICPLRVDWRAATQFTHFLVGHENYFFGEQY